MYSWLAKGIRQTGLNIRILPFGLTRPPTERSCSRLSTGLRMRYRTVHAGREYLRLQIALIFRLVTTQLGLIGMLLVRTPSLDAGNIRGSDFKLAISSPAKGPIRITNR